MNIKDISIGAILHPITQFFKHFHGIIFFLLLGAMLIAASLMTISIINSTGPGEPKATIDATFDQETIREVENLDPDQISTPSGRINPFVE